MALITNFDALKEQSFFQTEMHSAYNTRLLQEIDPSEAVQIAAELKQFIDSDSGETEKLKQTLSNNEKINKIYPIPSLDKELANQIYSDLTTLISAEPSILKSVRGVASGVWFINTSRSRFVLKWAPNSEYVCNTIYTTILQRINDPTLQVPDHFQIPKGWDLVPFDKSPPGQRNKEKLTPILFSRAPGATLLDFVATRYHTLGQEEKNQLFQGLGKIVMLDLFLGHQDRLCKFDTTTTTTTFQKMRDADNFGEYANLGNLMISLQSGNVSFFLIDNTASCENSNINHLKPFLGTDKQIKQGLDNAFSQVSQLMIQQLHGALTHAEFPGGPATTDIQQQNMENFAKNFTAAAQYNIREGFEYMRTSIKTHLIGTGPLFQKPPYNQTREVNGLMGRIKFIENAAQSVKTP